MAALMFYILGTVSVLSALLAVTRRDAVTSAFWLIFCFVNVAGLFALLSAHLLAVLQILLYAGAIMVFFLFVIMFLGQAQPQRPGFLRPAVLGGGATVVATMLLLLRQVGDAGLGGFPELPEGYGGIEGVSDLLLRSHIFSFELTGLLLTVAVIGAVLLARRQAPGPRGTRVAQLDEPGEGVGADA